MIYFSAHIALITGLTQLLKNETCKNYRYIAKQIEGMRAEMIMMGALNLARWKKWLEMRAAVEHAFDLMTRVLVEADQWFALVVHTHENGGTMLADSLHCEPLLVDQLRSLDLIRDAACTRCDQARAKCERRLQELEKFLQPQWKERDDVKAHMGEEK